MRIYVKNLIVILAVIAPAIGSAFEPPASGAVQESALPVIDLWYGDRQTFGPAGEPQPLVNVLGSVDPVAEVADATFRVNGGRGHPIVFGPDLHRLARPGDFNLEIDRSTLKDGENTVQIRLRTPTGREVSKDLVIMFEKNAELALPLEIDFSKVDRLQDVVEVTDGKWSLTGEGVRTTEPYYDRQLTFGDRGWKDVELHAEIIFHRHFVDFEGRNREGPPYLSHAHTSFNLRWAGHPDDGFRPRRDWMNLGALIALRSDLATPKQGAYWWMHFGRGIPGKPAPRSLISKEQRIGIETEVPYHYRMRAETVSEAETRYSTKVWRKGNEEPDDWQFQAIDQSEAVSAGSVVFVVHHSDVTLCRLRVESLNSSEAPLVK